MYDILVLGAGPAGLSAAALAVEKGFSCVVLEQGCIGYSVYCYPYYLQFFATTEELAIADMPFISIHENPTRTEVLRYYQKAARRINVEYRLRTTATGISGSDNAFLVRAVNEIGEEQQFRSKKIIIATGSYQKARLLHIPGEELPKVSHFYKDPYTYEGSRVLLVGGGDSAAEAALELIDNNVAVTMSYRQTEFARLKPWVKSRLLRAIERKRLTCHMGSLLKEIRQEEVLLWIKERGEQVLENDFVLLLTGYGPDINFLKQTGITVNDSDGKPAYFQENCETNISGIYLAGIIQSGYELGEQTVDMFRNHGEVIINDILSRM